MPAIIAGTFRYQDARVNRHESVPFLPKHLSTGPHRSTNGRRETSSSGSARGVSRNSNVLTAKTRRNSGSPKRVVTPHEPLDLLCFATPNGQYVSNTPYRVRRVD